jgi:hypothetical protein
MTGIEESTPTPQKYLEKFQNRLLAERWEQLDEELEPPRNHVAVCQESSSISNAGATQVSLKYTLRV